jgi:hypothetical protein
MVKTRWLTKLRAPAVGRSTRRLGAFGVVLAAAMASCQPTCAPPPPAPASGDSFFEDFTGNQGLERFRHGIFYRDADAHGFGVDGPGDHTWHGDHDMHCGPPTTHRSLDKVDRSSPFYLCRDHLMTSVGDVDGYAVAWFSPNQTFGRVWSVCFDVNISANVLEDRQWWEVAVVPASAPDAFAIDWLAGTANLPSYGDVGATVLGFGPDDPQYLKVSVGNRVTGSGQANDAQARNDIARRVPHCFEDLGNGTLRVSTVNDDGTPYTFTAAGSFPAGPVKVVFKDHDYTPDKACGGTCRSYTWHWDTIRIN